MSRLARTPINFPRMKVRGRRNRARSAERHSQHYTIRANPLQTLDGSVQFMPDPFGSHVIEATTPTRDGWGRVVAPSPKPQPVTRPRSPWHFSTSMELSGADPQLSDLITGKATS